MEVLYADNICCLIEEMTASAEDFTIATSYKDILIPLANSWIKGNYLTFDVAKCKYML